MLTHRPAVPARALLLVLALAATAGANLLANPDFSQWDDDSTPTAWTVESRTNAAVAREAGQGHAAPPCLKLTRLVAGTGNNKGVLQRVDVSPGQNYTVSVWFTTPAMPDTMQYVSGRVIITWRNSAGGSIGSTNPPYVHQPVWTEETYVAAAPNNPIGDSVADSADVIIRCYGRSGGLAGGILIADDASLTLGGAVAEGPQPANGGTALSVMPNPAGRSPRVSLNLGRAGPVRLVVYDLAGTERAVLHDGRLPAGHHKFGLNAAAGALPSGLYFVVLETAGRPPLVNKVLLQH
ncbi:hypothetical protein FJY71_03735 [candidate division WOR-3 bacterium]|nr:hypothetical protein [candidate division WOR-3 bacterium]